MATPLVPDRKMINRVLISSVVGTAVEWYDFFLYGTAAALVFAMRFFQGLGVGGEWGGAVLLVVETVPERKRGFFGSFPQLGVPIGLLLSTGVFALVSQLPNDQFLSWGWRIPFLLSVVLIGIGLF